MALVLSIYLLPINVLAQFADFATFEVGDANIDSYTTNATDVTPFTTITFDGEFENPPNVFVVTPETAATADPCIVRIRNVTTTSFEATCLESVNEDRNIAADIPFNYIAIEDGGVTVPLVDGSGDLVLQSACADISSEQFGPACNGCTGAQGFDAVAFSPAFTSADGDGPAILTQMQTANNVRTTAPIGEPLFIDPAIQTNSLDNTGYNLALDRMEAEPAPLNESEEICYLAVERNGCQEADFSSIGGLSSVMFEALHGGNVDGHDNGCTSGEGATFEGGCFSSTPIALGGKNERAGSNGGWLRRCDTNSTEVTFTFDEDTVSNAERAHIDEDISVLAFGALFTTPVTLTSAQVSRLGRNATFEWQTSAETFHLGFNLWGETSEGWVQLNAGLIKGNGVDSGETQRYREQIRLSRSQDSEISQFGISSVDNTGYEEFYGPFTEDLEYGEEANNEPVDWTSTRAAFEQSMQAQGYVQYNNRWFRVNSRIQELIKNYDLGVNRLHFDVGVDASGIHSLNASELIALNPSWENAALSSIALTLNGEAVSRHIISDDSRLSGDDKIVFNAGSVIGDDTPFLETYTYRLSVDPTRVVDASRFDGTEFDDQRLTESSLISELVTQKKLHSAGLTTGDPWFDARLLTTGTPASVSYLANFEYEIDTEQAGVVDVVLFGSLDLPGEVDDHHVQVLVNDQLISDFTFDGLVGYRDQISVPAGVLTDGDNTVTVTVVGDTGFFADVVLVDEVTVSAMSSLANPERTSFDFVSDESAEGYRITGAASGALQVYAYTNTGLLSTVDATSVDGSIAFSALPFEVDESNPAELRYSASVDWPSPNSIEVVEGQDLHSEETDYLIVAHPTFMGEALDEFVEFKTDLGFNVRVVDWLAMVNTYGYGNNTPKALDNFLSAANALYTTENVLIVGGHTFDYFGITDDNIVNFIPSHYERVSVFEYTATDNPYADLDGDNIPEIAIGRWPVRSVADLQTIISKTVTWHENRAGDQFQDAYLLAQARDSQSLDFAEQLEGRVAAPLSQLEGINQVNQLSLDELPEGVTDVVSFTRAQLAEQINSGTELISFSGHASQTSWGFQNIINTDFIRSLENQGQPSLLMPLACYITHFEDVSTNTLAHQWLFAGEQGAAAIHGASVLGEYRENGLFAERYLRRSAEQTTVGGAILEAKKQLGSQNEILHNWVLLGDPTLPIR